MLSPCKDCQNRALHCHSRCEKYQVYAEWCEARREKRKQAHTVGETDAKQEPPPPKRRIKPIPQCVREADALGISYGRYVQREYDKITWKRILKLEVL